jgi:hypothetical protein
MVPLIHVPHFSINMKETTADSMMSLALTPQRSVNGRQLSTHEQNRINELHRRMMDGVRGQTGSAYSYSG